MQYFLRFTIALLTFVTGLVVWSALKPAEPKVSRSTDDSSLNVTLSPIRFYEWRRYYGEGAMKPASQPAPLWHSYHQLKEWDLDLSQTGQIDIICRLENRGRQPVDLTLLAIGDIRLKVRGGPRLESFVLTKANIGQQVVQQLAPGEAREVKFTNFDLKALAKRHVPVPDGTDRAAELYVNVNVMRLEDNVLTSWAGGRLPLTRAPIEK